MDGHDFYASLVGALAKYGYRFNARDLSLEEIEKDKLTASVAIAVDLVPSVIKALIGSHPLLGSTELRPAYDQETLQKHLNALLEYFPLWVRVATDESLHFMANGLEPSAKADLEDTYSAQRREYVGSSGSRYFGLVNARVIE